MLAVGTTTFTCALAEPLPYPAAPGSKVTEKVVASPGERTIAVWLASIGKPAAAELDGELPTLAETLLRCSIA
jgi:hypothetical protein